MPQVQVFRMTWFCQYFLSYLPGGTFNSGYVYLFLPYHPGDMFIWGVRLFGITIIYKDNAP